MYSARIIAVISVPLLVLSACSSAKQAVTTASTTAVASSPAISTASSAPSTTATHRTTTAKPTTTKPTSKPGPTTDPLTGGGPSKNPVIAVKIDNTYFDVAQFGVSDADVVFVEQVEGGLTRIIGVFHSTLPTEVGPVRSVRSTDAQLLPAFGKPGLVFSGGAGGPLADLAATSIVDTSALGDAYFRSDVASGTYNLHADLTKIAAQAKGLGPVRYVGFSFAANSAVVAKGRAVANIQVVMEAGETDFAYTAGHFVRMQYGQQVSDYQGKVEAADNVMVMNVVDTPDGTVDSNGQPSYLTQTVGAGKLTLYRDGRAVGGTWKRAKSTDSFTFLDATGKPLPMKPGKTWVILAPQTAVVTAN